MQMHPRNRPNHHRPCQHSRRPVDNIPLALAATRTPHQATARSFGPQHRGRRRGLRRDVDLFVDEDAVGGEWGCGVGRGTVLLPVSV